MSTIVCAHGFGVRADSRGMFTDIASALPEHTFVMFDFNEVRENGDTVVPSLRAQAETLQSVINEQPGDVVVLAHSQGCIIVGMIDPSKVTKFILLAPPVEMSMQRVLAKLAARPGAEINLAGMSKLPRRDGTTTYLTQDYVRSLDAVEPIELYENMARKKPTTIIRATKDEVIGRTNFTAIKNAEIIDIAADHNFTNQARSQLVSQLAQIV